MTITTQYRPIQDSIDQYKMILVITSDLEGNKARQTKTSDIEDEEDKNERSRKKQYKGDENM